MARRLEAFERQALDGGAIPMASLVARDLSASGELFGGCGYGDEASTRYTMSGVSRGTRALFEDYAGRVYGGNRAMAWRSLCVLMLWVLSGTGRLFADRTDDYEAFLEVARRSLCGSLSRDGVSADELAGYMADGGGDGSLWAMLHDDRNFDF